MRRKPSCPSEGRRPWFLRRAGRKDLGPVLRVETEVFRAAAFSRSQVSYMLTSSRGLTVLALAGSEPAGFVAVSWRRGASTCRIVNLAVRREFRGLGIGRSLVMYTLRFGRQEAYAGVTLEVEEKNRAAKSLYAKLGFVAERRLLDYYEDGRHALRLVRWFAA